MERDTKRQIGFWHALVPCFRLSPMTVKKLFVIWLLVCLSVFLYVRPTYLSSIGRPLRSKDRHLFVQTNNIYSRDSNLSLQNIRHGTRQFYPKLASEQSFLMEKIINSQNFEYVIRPTVTCSVREVELTICVVTTRDNHMGRSVIRQTWGRYAKDPNNKAVLVFFVGSANNETETVSNGITQTKVQKEASIFGDIVQENYIDSYRNLSLKSMSILKWVNSFCPKTRYILKVDDDMYVNIPFLMTTLQEFVSNSSPPIAFILGYLIANNKPHRWNSSKYFTPYTVYREDKYPNFVSGTAYVMTGAAARLLYQASLRVPLFWLEDVFITGLCARKAGVRVYSSKYFTNEKLFASGCSFREMVSGHDYTQEEIIKLHTELSDPNLQC